MRLERWMDQGGLACWRLGGRAIRAGSTWQTWVSGEVWLWLNRAGEGVIWGSEERMFLRPGMYAIFGGGEKASWRWTRLPGEHEAEVVVISRAWLARRLGGAVDQVQPPYRSWLKKGGKLASAGLMTGAERELGDGLRRLGAADSDARMRAEAAILNWVAGRLVRAGRASADKVLCQGS